MKENKIAIRIKQLVFIVAIFIMAKTHAQYFGGNPIGQKWLQYNTDVARVIFPNGMENAAKRVLENASKIQQNDRSSLGTMQRKISVILQNGRTESNAYVGLAPWRSEFYTIAPQDPFELGALNWVDNLSIHEFRHVQQYSNFNQGLSKFASILLGEQGQVVANSAAVPDWFFEGDAVYNETKFSPQGRGKLALFMSSYKSLYLSQKHYNYMQMRNGSYRKYIPNHYDLGYLLVTYGRKKYGDSIWHSITADAASFKSVFYPFQKAVQKYTGISFPQFVADAMKFYQLKWDGEKEAQPKWVSATTMHDVVDYRYPYATQEGSMVVLKKSLKNIPAFYLVEQDGTEKKIANRAISFEDYYSYKNNQIIYASYQPDIRWGNREYNSIQVLNIQNGVAHQLATHTKYYAPDISMNGQLIAAVEMDPIKGASLVLLDSAGKQLQHFHKEGWVLASPKFSANDQAVFFTARNDLGEMSLMKKSIDSAASPKTIIPFSNQIIGYLTVQGDTLLYTISNQGRDEIWALIEKGGNYSNYRMASYATGLYQAVLSDHGTKLIGSVFTADGYRLASFLPKWQLNATGVGLKDLYIPELYRASEEALLKTDQATTLLAEKYGAAKGLVKLHSWRPMYSDPEYSFTLYSDNVLNTFHSELAYTYNQNEGSHKLGVSGVYGGTFLQPMMGWDQFWSRSGYYRNDTLLHWNESNAYIGLQLPLNLSGGKAFRYFTISSTYHFDQLKWTGIGEKLFQNKQFNAVQSRIDYLSQMQQAKQQIYPHWGQRLTVQYKTLVGHNSATQLLLAGSFYLPGLSNNHSIVVSAAYQQRDTLQQYLFSNGFPFSRGYMAVDFPRMWKIGFNYHLPIAYPEWGFGNIVYLSRIRANTFYDYTRGKSLRTGIQYDFASTGAEIYLDTKWWNQQAVSFGIRYSRLLNNEFRGITQPNVWEFIMPINLF